MEYQGQMDQLEDKTFKKGAANPLSYPLTAIPAPAGSALVSPKIGKKHGINNLIKNNEQKLLDEVLETVGMVRRGEFPHDFMEKYYPPSWGAYERKMPEPLVGEGLRLSSPAGCANVVHMDNPLDMPIATQGWLLDTGAKPIQRDTGHIDFLNAVPDVVLATAQGMRDALHDCFEVKYYYGEGRPEELACANITSYPEGCPNHPSFPAGHGAAAAGGNQALLTSYKLTPKQIKTTRDTAYFWAMFRTFAGVHYYPDNLAGLAVGGLLDKAELNSKYWE